MGSKKSLWLLVTEDKYEFPLLICDSLQELAAKTGVKAASIKQSVSRGENGKYKKSKWRRVRI